jgi:glyoxylase-like metal-dependent hydrolase (beta-lactamase superfamily II)
VKIEDGIWRVDGTRGGNAYLAETPEGLVVIDTGMPGGAARVLAEIAAIGGEPADLSAILLTHSDIDHVGGVAELKRRTGARVAVGTADAEALRGNAKSKPRKGIARVILGVLMRFIKAEPAEPDVLLSEGDQIAGFEVLAIPGHTAGSVALVRDGVVFAGDTVLGSAEGDPLPPREGLSADIAEANASSQRILNLDWRLILPGHGEPIRR